MQDIVCSKWRTSKFPKVIGSYCFLGEGYDNMIGNNCEILYFILVWFIVKNIDACPPPYYNTEHNFVIMVDKGSITSVAKRDIYIYAYIYIHVCVCVYRTNANMYVFAYENIHNRHYGIENTSFKCINLQCEYILFFGPFK